MLPLESALAGTPAFAACRPPGHHALADRAMGFCLLANAVIVARAAQRQGVDRVLIVDWDVHHGNGTQALMEHDPAIRYVSLHQWPAYPGTGRADERGVGNVFNVPMPPGLPAARYVEALWTAVLSATEGWTPSLVLVSAGFDAMRGDPLGGFTLEPHDYAELTRRLRTHCPEAGFASLLEEIRQKQEALERELQSAARYVETLLPASGPVVPGVQMVRTYRPSLALGGDLFNIVPWSDDFLGLYLLDASGHGVSAALRSSSFATFLRRDSLLRHVGSNDPGAILTEANKQFPLTENGHYFTIVFASLDLRCHTLSYATAGHSGALLHRRSGAVCWMAQPNLPLGFDSFTTYVTVELPITPGDRLYLFSDGLYEVPDPTGELWGQARLDETIRRFGERPFDRGGGRDRRRGDSMAGARTVSR